MFKESLQADIHFLLIAVWGEKKDSSLCLGVNFYEQVISVIYSACAFVRWSYKVTQKGKCRNSPCGNAVTDFEMHTNIHPSSHGLNLRMCVRGSHSSAVFNHRWALTSPWQISTCVWDQCSCTCGSSPWSHSVCTITYHLRPCLTDWWENFIWQKASVIDHRGSPESLRGAQRAKNYRPQEGAPFLDLSTWFPGADSPRICVVITTAMCMHTYDCQLHHTKLKCIQHTWG